MIGRYIEALIRKVLYLTLLYFMGRASGWIFTTKRTTMGKVKLTEEQLKRAKSMRWYHAIDFGEYQARGRNRSPYPPNMTLYGVMDILSGIDVKGMRVLEIGPAHGMISIGLAIQGASVTACDVGGKKPPQISFCEEVFGIEIDYRAPLALEDVGSVFEKASFDLIVCAGVMYHLINPADVFFRLRPLLKQNGLMVMETVYAAKEKEPVLVLNTEKTLMAEPTTYFVASESAIRGMAKLASLEVLASRVNSPSRFTIIGRAVKPDEVSDRSEFLERVHNTGIIDPIFQNQKTDFDALSQSGIKFSGDLGHKRIDVKTHKPNFVPCPTELSNPIGLSFWKNK